MWESGTIAPVKISSFLHAALLDRLFYLHISLARNDLGNAPAYKVSAEFKHHYSYQTCYMDCPLLRETCPHWSRVPYSEQFLKVAVWGLSRIHIHPRWHLVSCVCFHSCCSHTLYLELVEWKKACCRGVRNTSSSVGRRKGTAEQVQIHIWNTNLEHS